MMAEPIDNLVLENLKQIQAEQTAARDRDGEILRRLSHLEILVSRMGRDLSDWTAEMIEDRHGVDKLRARVERIERRLDLVD